MDTLSASEAVRQALEAVRAVHGALPPVPGDDEVGGALSALAQAMNVLDAELTAQATRAAR